jgi:hypothetical protein
MNFGIKRVLGLVGAAALGLSMLAPAMAADTTVTAIVNGAPGAFNLALGSASFSGTGVTYDRDNAQTITGSATYEVEDGRGLYDGSGGWNVRMSTATNFEYTLPGSGDVVTIPTTGNFIANPDDQVTSSPTLDPVSNGQQPNIVSNCPGANGQGPIAYYCNVNVPLSPGTSGKVLATNPNWGNGIYDHTTNLKLNVPPATIAGDYSTTLTVTLVAGNAP